MCYSFANAPEKSNGTATVVTRFEYPFEEVPRCTRGWKWSGLQASLAPERRASIRYKAREGVAEASGSDKVLSADRHHRLLGSPGVGLGTQGRRST
jgi:hypothetical protein